MSLKIEFGCGGRKLDGWICTEIDKCDITRPLPYNDNSCDELYISHVVEHVASPQSVKFFEECHRILQDGGTLRICVPTISPALSREHARGLLVDHGHLQAFDENIMITMLWASGFDIGKIRRTGKRPMDNHANVIGVELDEVETLRIEATK